MVAGGGDDRQVRPGRRPVLQGLEVEHVEHRLGRRAGRGGRSRRRSCCRARRASSIRFSGSGAGKDVTPLVVGGQLSS